MIKTITIAITESKAKYIFLLFRPIDHIFFTAPLVIIGYAAGARIEHTTPNTITLLILILANILAISFAFAINEIEDAEDDKKDPNRKNPIARGNLTRKQALAFTFSAFFISLTAFSLVNKQTMLTGAAILVISFFYSYKGVRLKSMPLIDLISHALMLAALIMLSGYLAVSNQIYLALPILAACFFGSVHGQFDNQIRDFKEDKKAKLNNTTLLVGLPRAKQLAMATLIVAILFILYSFYTHTLPLFLLPITLAAVPFVVKGANKIPKEFLRNMRWSADYITAWTLLNLFSVAFLISSYIGS